MVAESRTCESGDRVTSRRNPPLEGKRVLHLSRSVMLLHDLSASEKFVICVLQLVFCFCVVQSNPDAKRLYDDLLSNYNRLIRPVSNNTDTVLVKLGLRLSQLIDLVNILVS